MRRLSLWLTTALAFLTVAAAAVAQPPPDPLTRLPEEPSVREVQQAALGAAGYADGDLDDWSARARWSHLLPEVSGEAAWLDQRDEQTRYREDMVADGEAMYRDEAQNDIIADSRLRAVYAVELEWDLSGLVFDRSEPSIAREVRQRREARAELMAEVADVYYARRSAQAALVTTPEADWQTRLRLQLEVRRQTARLDALTGLWFSRALDDGRSP